MNPKEIAQVCHEANRALQKVQDDLAIGVSPPWEKLDTETRASVIEGVLGVMRGKSPEESHQNWLEFKREHGWKYGPVKDIEAKTHPCMRPYEELEAHYKVKDHLFVSIVKALM